MSPVTIDEVNSLLANLDISKASDPYSFPVKMIKNISNIISDLLHIVFNQSLQYGTLPDKLKYAKVSLYTRMVQRMFLETIDQFLYHQFLVKYLNKS